ncbi:hypothetical protein Pla22_52180 [Rubripirellula amarantea]|uniref:Uncharacterized protein n=1 Tax=Rubripirellula amarantea TaxID=2527999 RepID=A0A5C5WDZ8_9BACT|nr:hypothetical protein Pla22_52180 [Rubripirellula amarantea]
MDSFEILLLGPATCFIAASPETLAQRCSVGRVSRFPTLGSSHGQRGVLLGMFLVSLRCLSQLPLRQLAAVGTVVKG